MTLTGAVLPKKSPSKNQRWPLWLFACCVSCRHAPPPAPPPPPPVAPAPQPPPPPKCEKPEEACISKTDTRARIRESGWDFVPPEGWTYAQEAEQTVATGKNAALAVTARDKSEDKKPREEREDALRALLDKLGVTLPKRKIVLPKKPDQSEKIADLAVELFQLDGAKREGKKGPLLVFAADLPDRRVLVGVGFVADDDQDNSDGAIMSSIHSLARATTADKAGKKSP
jgi:hypothetical protein